MIVIRRLVDRHCAYTGIFLKGEPPKIFPTTDYEHARILQIYKQDRRHEGIVNDFSDYALGEDTLTSASPEPVAQLTKKEPAAGEPRRGRDVRGRRRRVG